MTKNTRKTRKNRQGSWNKLALLCALCMGIAGCANGQSGIASACLTESMVWKPQTVSLQNKADSSEMIWQFGWNALQLLSQQGRESAVFAPVSSIAMISLLAQGSQGETREEIEQAVKGDAQAILNAGAAGAGLQSELPKGYAFAASMWINSLHGNTVSEDFCGQAKTLLDTDIYVHPFQNGIQEEIDAWVSKKTSSQISSAPCSVSADNVLALLTAMAFEQPWKNHYEDEDVQSGFFHNQDGSEAAADYLASGEDYVLETEVFEGIIKPCQDENFVFAALMPKDGASIEESLSAENWQALADALKAPGQQRTEVLLPMFEAEANSDLKPVLRQLGIERAFTSSADFSNISDEGILIDEIRQSSRIQIDQQGVKAASADMALFDTISYILQDEPERQIVFDRPFLYLIYAKEYEMPLMMGIQCEIDPK